MHTQTRWAVRICVLAGLFTSVGCARTSGEGTKPHAGEDDGKPLGPGSASIQLEGAPQELVHFHGAVLQLRPPKGDSGLDSWWLVDVAGGRPFYVLLLPLSRKPPFSVGETIDVSIDCRHGGRIPVCDGVIRDASGVLLAALSASGRLPVPDWIVEKGSLASSFDHSKGWTRSVEQTYSLMFSHLGKRTVSPPREWRQLTTTDATWLVSGQAIAWEGKRLSEGLDYQQFAIMRSR